MRTAAGTHRNYRRLAVKKGVSSKIFIHRYSSHGVWVPFHIWATSV
jgi:hypothetical protein